MIYSKFTSWPPHIAVRTRACAARGRHQPKNAQKRHHPKTSRIPLTIPPQAPSGTLRAPIYCDPGPPRGALSRHLGFGTSQGALQGPPRPPQGLPRGPPGTPPRTLQDPSGTPQAFRHRIQSRVREDRNRTRNRIQKRVREAQDQKARKAYAHYEPGHVY